jgi:NTE family protein
MIMAKKLGIAFGGSGAQGIANIAYVKAMEAAEIKPDIVAGTGVGAVVASMYAAGMTSQHMIDFLQEINFPGAKKPISILKVKDSKYGILDGLGLEEHYRMIVPIKVFDRLYFPLKVVAVNYLTGEQLVFETGDVGSAVRSAIAIPGVFSPHEVNGVVMMDGSCINPVPFDVIRDDCDILAAIDPQINESPEAYTPFVFPAMMAASAASKKALAIEKERACKVDAYERVVMEEINMLDFALFADIIQAAEESAGAFVERLKELL